MFIRKGEALDWTIGTVQMYINKYQFWKKHSGKNFIEHNINMHLNCFVYGKLVNYVKLTYRCLSTNLCM